MEQQPAKKRRGPASKLGKILINLIVTAVVGFLYFYVALPPINLQSSDFYTFIGILCVVYVVSALITSGMNVVSSGGGPKEYLRFIKTQCLPVGILFLALIAVASFRRRGLPGSAHRGGWQFRRGHRRDFL